MKTTYTILISGLFILIFGACQNNKKTEDIYTKKENPNKKYIESQMKILDRPNGYYKNLELTYLYDLDTLKRDSFLSLDKDSIYHIFQEINFKFITPDSIIRKATLNTVSYDYYRNHKFKPSFFEVSYYSDDLLGLNLGSKEHGNMKCGMFDTASGDKISGFAKDNYQGSFFLGSMTKHDTFEELRVILKVDSLIYEQTYLTKDIDDRIISEDLEK